MVFWDPALAPAKVRLSPRDEAIFFEAIAQGATIKRAGALVGMTHATALKVFEEFRATLGEQGE